MKNLTLIISSLLIAAFMLFNCDERKPTTVSSDYSISISKSSNVSYASFKDSIEVTAMLVDNENNQAVAEKQITFTTSTTGNYTLNNLQTNNQGKVTTYYFDDDVIGNHFISAIYDDMIALDSISTVPLAENIGVLSLILNNGIDFVFPENYDNSPQTIIVKAIVNDGNGMLLDGATVNFVNNNPDLGSLTAISAVTNSTGIAEVEFIMNTVVNGTAIITANIGELEAISEVYISPYSDEDFDEIDQLRVWVTIGEQLIDNINVTFTDTLTARVLNASGGPIGNVPLAFTITSDTPGFLSLTQADTDTLTGLASCVFSIDPESLNPEDIEEDINVQIQVSVLNSEEFIETVNITVHIDPNYATPELNVTEFHFYPNTEEFDHIMEEETEIKVIAKNNAGVGICNVPVQFELMLSRDSNGEISTALAYTECIEESDTSATSHQNGVATVLYSNIQASGTDLLRAYISDPNNSSVILWEDEISIDSKTVEEVNLERVTSMNTWLSATTISIINADSAYADTVYATALDEFGATLPNILFNFELDNASHGQLTESSVVSDSLGIAKTIFNLLPGTTDQVINITVSIPGSVAQPQTLEINFIDDTPPCPGCEAELSITLDKYILPDEDASTVSMITATMVDSLGNIPDMNTLIAFTAQQQDENGEWLDVGNINPYSYFNEDGFAFAEFSMGNSAGLATIIGNSAGMSDTVYVTMNSIEASFIEIIQPFPNEIMVQGGGGNESTLITAEVKDGNGNLVTDVYNVTFRITQPSPFGVHLNGEDGVLSITTECANGLANVTVNSGTAPGSVRMAADLYTLDGELVATMNSIPVTIVTAPPEFGEINFSYVDIVPIGGGLYNLPVSIHIWDLHSNPVADSTNVYTWVREFPENSTSDPGPHKCEWLNDYSYIEGDKVWWGTNSTDTLTYLAKSNLPPGDAFSPEFDEYWERLPQPASIIGECKTGMENDNGDKFPGVAWTTLTYSSSFMFTKVVLFAQTFNAEGGYLIIDSRDNNQTGSPMIQPFQPGVISASASLQFWDFNEDVNGGPFTDDITITGTIIDFYQYPIANARLQLIANGANIISVNPIGPDPNDPSIGLSNANGQVQWIIKYEETLCPQATVDPITYSDYISTVFVQLLDPLQTSSDPIDITLINSTIE